jgi:hypothetical protein
VQEVEIRQHFIKVHSNDSALGFRAAPDHFGQYFYGAQVSLSQKVQLNLLTRPQLFFNPNPRTTQGNIEQLQGKVSPQTESTAKQFYLTPATRRFALVSPAIPLG